MRSGGTGQARPLVLGMEWLDDEPGGLNRYVADLHRALAAAGAGPRTVVVGPGAGAPAGVVTASAVSEPLPRRLLAFRAAADRLAPGHDVVDVHFALYAALPVLAGRARRLPLVVHFHGPWAAETAANSDGGGAAVWAKRRVERAVYRRARRSVVLSRAFAETLARDYGVAPWSISVVPPGVDRDRFSPGEGRAAARAALGLPPDLPVAFSARRLVPRMGLDVLLDAWAELPGAPLLAIAGTGELAGPLAARAAALGLADRVRLLGQVPERDLVTWYRAADVSVVPTLSLEGFGLVAVESLACGTPVVASDVGGLREAIGALDASLLVPAGSAGALAGRLAGAFDGSAPLPSAADCVAYSERFDWSRVARTLLGLMAEARDAGPRRPRVVYVDHTGALGGAELALARTISALRGVDAHVVLGGDGPFAAELARRGISYEVLPLDPRAAGQDRAGSAAALAGSAVSMPAYVVRLARRLRALRPDLVHTNSLKAGLYGAPAARLARVPVVWHARDRIAGDYLPPRTAAAVRRLADRLPAAVVANSRATLDTLALRRTPHWVVPSPGAAVAPRPPRAAGAPFRVGVLGRVAPWKGQDVFVRAVAAAFPDGDVQGVVVGAPLFGEDAYAAEVERLAKELGADVDFRGWRDDVEAELHRLDVLVHCSTVPEPFGQVVVEGMAAGLPVVASDAGGPAEVVTDGVDGLLVPPGDPEALAAALRRLRADPALRDRLGGRAVETARRYGADRVAEQLLEVYAAVRSR